MLICTPSNAACDEICARLLDLPELVQGGGGGGAAGGTVVTKCFFDITIDGKPVGNLTLCMFNP